MCVCAVMKVVPPNFGYVEDQIFRCGLPDSRHYAFLSSLRLKTCILLTDTPHHVCRHWLIENGVRVLCPLASPQGLLGNAVVVSNTISGAMERVGPATGGGQGSSGSEFAAIPTSSSSNLLAAHHHTSAGSSASLMMNAGVAAASGMGRRLPVATDISPSGGGAVFSSLGGHEMRNSESLSRLPSSLMEDPQWSAAAQALEADVGGAPHALMSLSEPVVVQILELLLDPTNYPLLITCPKGRYRTGIVCGCLRKIQGWNLVSILEEYRRYAGDKSRAENEEFIELFDIDLVKGAGRNRIIGG